MRQEEDQIFISGAAHYPHHHHHHHYHHAINVHDDMDRKTSGCDWRFIAIVAAIIDILAAFIEFIAGFMLFLVEFELVDKQDFPSLFEITLELGHTLIVVLFSWPLPEILLSCFLFLATEETRTKRYRVCCMFVVLIWLVWVWAGICFHSWIAIKLSERDEARAAMPIFQIFLFIMVLPYLLVLKKPPPEDYWSPIDSEIFEERRIQAEEMKATRRSRKSITSMEDLDMDDDPLQRKSLPVDGDTDTTDVRRSEDENVKMVRRSEDEHPNQREVRRSIASRAQRRSSGDRDRARRSAGSFGAAKQRRSSTGSDTNMRNSGPGPGRDSADITNTKVPGRISADTANTRKHVVRASADANTNARAPGRVSADTAHARMPARTSASADVTNTRVPGRISADTVNTRRKPGRAARRSSNEDEGIGIKPLSAAVHPKRGS